MIKFILAFGLFLTIHAWAAEQVGSWNLGFTPNKDAAFIMVDNEKDQMFASYCFAGGEGCIWTLTFKDQCRENEITDIFITISDRVRKSSLKCLGKNDYGDSKHVFVEYALIKDLSVDGVIEFTVLQNYGAYNMLKFHLNDSALAKMKLAAINWKTFNN